MTTDIDHALLRKMAHGVLIPEANNFTPETRTPWGGYKIISDYKAHLGIESHQIVGESWEMSNHPDFPNTFRIEQEGAGVAVIPITVLEEAAREALYGPSGLSYLVKLLNSGSWSVEKALLAEYRHIPQLRHLLSCNHHELHQGLVSLSLDYPEIRPIHREMLLKNLSIQVHPQRESWPGAPSKHEAWIILDREPGAGIYLGLKEGVSRARCEAAMQEGEDFSLLMNFIEVSPGDVYDIPPGTLHAIGAGILLLEPQECAQTTFRAYDWGKNYFGRSRPLHIEEVCCTADWHGDQGEELRRRLQKKSDSWPPIGTSPSRELLIDTRLFSCRAISLPEVGHEWIYDRPRTSLSTLFVAKGGVDVIDGQGEVLSVAYGRSILIPAMMPYCRLRATVKETLLLETGGPVISS